MFLLLCRPVLLVCVRHFLLFPQTSAVHCILYSSAVFQCHILYYSAVFCILVMLIQCNTLKYVQQRMLNASGWGHIAVCVLWDNKTNLHILPTFLNTRMHLCIQSFSKHIRQIWKTNSRQKSKVTKFYLGFNVTKIFVNITKIRYSFHAK